MEPIKTIEIEYYTPELQPPFAYTFFLVITNVKGRLNVKSEIQYFGWEDYNDEDLLSSGLTEEDNFTWQGEITSGWLKEVNSLVDFSAFSQEEEHQNCFVKVIFEDGSMKEGFPDRQSEWNFLIQELQQAVLEASGRELPFSVHFKQVDKQDPIYLSVIASFAERKSVIIKSNGNEEKKSDLEWNRLKELMGQVFSLDYRQELGSEEEPIKEGLFIEPGDGAWYPLPEGVEKPEKNKTKTKELIETFRSL